VSGTFSRSRRTLLAGVMAWLAWPARAQRRFPSRPVRMIVAFPPGQAADFAARLLAQHLQALWGQSVVVENRGGGMGVPAMTAAKRAAGDGHTLVMATTSTLTTNPTLLPDLPYRPLIDFAGVSNVIQAPLLLVAHRDFPPRNLQEFLAHARKPGMRVPVATPGQGTSQHLILELFAARAAFEFEHLAYKGSGPAVIDLVAGQVPLMLDSVASSLPHIATGRLRALAVTTPKRIAQLTDTPTLVESGFPDVVGFGWAGLVVPASTPADLVQQISADVRKALDDTDVRSALAARSLIPDPRTPGDFAEFMRAETGKWARVIEEAGIRVSQ
jgi:tripartite-type tricarboxylate transporter receptor subunit TctC